MDNNFDYKDLEQRGSLAVELIRTVLTDLGLLISFKEADGVREVIFSDKSTYMNSGGKKAVSTEVKNLNATVFEDIREIPDHVLKNNKDIYIISKDEL